MAHTFCLGPTLSICVIQVVCQFHYKLLIQYLILHITYETLRVSVFNKELLYCTVPLQRTCRPAGDAAWKLAITAYICWYLSERELIW